MVNEIDPRADLVQKLIEYKMYKYAAIELKDMQLYAGKSLYKEPTIPEGSCKISTACRFRWKF